MKVLRSTLVAAVALVGAACGDKVTVQGPVDTTTAKVNSVTVSPSAATLNVGQTVTLTAVVDASNGAATTVTWASAAANVTVSAAGAVTAVSATPGVAVCATSTVDAGKKGCASIIVSAAPATIPATVSIQSITLNAGGLNAPVNPAAVAGVIDVRANIAPGTETVNKVVVQVGAVRADSQTFSAAQSAELRYAAEAATANQSAFPPILFTINTAKFNATTGVPTWLNGNNTVSILLFVTGNTAARSTATYQTPLTFANADTYVATVATTGTTANVNNASGFRYDRGGIAATVLPVSYSGRVVASGTLLFGSAACDANGTGQRSIALTAPAAGSTTWSATLPQTVPSGGATANTVSNYEFTNNGICTLNAVGETIAVTAVDANGDALFSAAAPVNVNALSSIRLDNKAPQGGNPALMQNPNRRGNGWINGSVNLVGTNVTAGTAISATSNNLNIRPATAACAGGTAAREDRKSVV